ncbi:MAG: hypothetical protein JWN46_2019 [Acidimicrobiales bacterium]|nr:hypothetical protein [Acidimicrobiales bacterium]
MLSDQLQADLTTAMKARDELSMSVLRLAIAAMKEEAVAGSAARELSDDEVRKVLAREVKRRDEAATAFMAGGRAERAAREQAERDVLARYLPAALGEDELTAIVDEALTEGGFDAPSQMGLAMKAAMARLGGRADGKAVSAIVRSRLGG